MLYYRGNYPTIRGVNIGNFSNGYNTLNSIIFLSFKIQGNMFKFHF